LDAFPACLSKLQRRSFAGKTDKTYDDDSGQALDIDVRPVFPPTPGHVPPSDKCPDDIANEEVQSASVSSGAIPVRASTASAIGVPNAPRSPTLEGKAGDQLLANGFYPCGAGGDLKESLTAIMAGIPEVWLGGAKDDALTGLN
jgi:hypothetical protein